jgi:hypothetical protein
MEDFYMKLTKKCSRYKCGKTKPVSEFYRNAARSDGLADYCKECHKAASKIAYEKSPIARAIAREKYQNSSTASKAELSHKNRIYDLKKKYNLTLEKLAVMHEEQDGKCLICTREVELVVDHSHVTGRVRGLLCRSCNSHLGWFEMYTNSILQYEL